MEKAEIRETTQATIINNKLLTLAEVEVLQMVSDGFTNTEIAQQLKTSVRTIETRRANLMEKTGTRNAASLIKFAVKNNLIN